MCDLWKDCANDSNDNCSSHLSPQPGKDPSSKQVMPVRAGKAPTTLSSVPLPSSLRVHGWASLLSSCAHFKDSQLVVALYTRVI
jgi:hypothetical protein